MGRPIAGTLKVTKGDVRIIEEIVKNSFNTKSENVFSELIGFTLVEERPGAFTRITVEYLSEGNG